MEAPATDRARLLEEVAPGLQLDARQLWPDSFAGLWIDEDAVKIAFTQNASEKVDQLARDSSSSGLLEAVTHERSLADLEGLLQRMGADRELARSGELSLPGVPGHLYDLDIDVERNAVLVFLEEPTAEAIVAFRERYGEAIIVVEGLARPHDCDTRLRCRPLLRSGLNASYGNLAPDEGCSTAFTVVLPSGDRGVLSAAHCGDDTDGGSFRYHDWYCDSQGCHRYVYGEVAGQQQSGRVDAERHTVEYWNFEARAWIYRTNDDKAWEVQSVGSWEAIAVGQPVCKAGRTTGQTCGDVLGKHYNPWWVPNSDRFVRTSYCSEGGDSGAGVYGGVNGAHPHRALGVHSGGGYNCGDPEAWGVFGHIEYVENALNVTVVQAP